MAQVCEEKEYWVLTPVNSIILVWSMSTSEEVTGFAAALGLHVQREKSAVMRIYLAIMEMGQRHAEWVDAFQALLQHARIVMVMIEAAWVDTFLVQMHWEKEYGLLTCVLILSLVGSTSGSEEVTELAVALGLHVQRAKPAVMRIYL